MIKPSDFAPLIAHPVLAPAVSSTRSAGAASPASWFDSSAVSGDIGISANLDPASRGLSVDQHASRVLAHLCGERGDGA